MWKHKVLLHFIRLERHKVFQIIVTTGTVTAFVISLVFPTEAVACGVVGVITNLIWCWE